MRTTKKGKFFLYLILTLGALLILFPMYITITTTFKTPAESAVSFFTLPKSLYLGNYATVLQDEKLYYAYGNTILITVVSLLGEMLILPPMGFALSRGMKQNRFFKGLYFFFLLGIFLPWAGAYDARGQADGLAGPAEPAGHYASVRCSRYLRKYVPVRGLSGHRQRQH